MTYGKFEGFAGNCMLLTGKDLSPVAGAGRKQKDVKNEGRSDYVHENKGHYDTLSGTKDGFFAQLHDNLHGRYAYLAPVKLENVAARAGLTALPSHFSGDGESPT